MTPYANDDLIDILDDLAMEVRRVAGVMAANPNHPEHPSLMAHAVELHGVAHLVESWISALLLGTP